MSIDFTNDFEPREDFSSERAIYLKESDYEFLIELLEPIEKSVKVMPKKVNHFTPQRQAMKSVITGSNAQITSAH